MKSKKILILLFITYFFGFTASMILQAFSMKKAELIAKYSVVPGNPLFDEFEKIGKRYGINMDFTKDAKCYKINVPDKDVSPVLKRGRESVDILIVGDSSVAWGLIPEVIEQITGKTVGIFAVEGLALNVTVARVINNVAGYYLKKDGLLLMSFGGWPQLTGADSKVMVFTKWMNKVSEMSHSEFAQFMENKGAPPQKGLSSLLGQLEFTSYRDQYKQIKTWLAKNIYMGLFQNEFYINYIEPFTSPKWHKVKKAMKKKIQCYLRWNERSLTIISVDLGVHSQYSDDPPDMNFRNKDLAIISPIIKKIDRTKAFLIHFNPFKKNYIKLRSIYANYYKGAGTVIDLGKVHPKDESFPMDHKEHTINSGGLYQSIFLGNELAKYFQIKN